MARGRFISNETITDREMNELSSDTCRLAFVYLITITDCEGRVIGEPDFLTSLLFPRRREITPKIVEGFIVEWINAGFVVWYINGNGDKVLQLINFDKHQKGLRKNREAPTQFDGPENCEILFPNGLKEKIKMNLNNKFKFNGNSGAEDAQAPDNVGTMSGSPHSQDNLMKYFLEKTKLEYPIETKNPYEVIKWEKEVSGWERDGVTDSDILAVIKEFDRDNLSIAWPGSLTKKLKSRIAKRKRGIDPDNVQNKSANHRETVEEMEARLLHPDSVEAE